VKPSPSLSPTGIVCITKFNDLNGNGVADPGDLLLPWSFTITPANGSPISVTTGLKGEPICRDFRAGPYSIAEVGQAGWIQTAPVPVGPQAVTVTAGQTVSLAFGNHQRSVVSPAPTLKPTPSPAP